MVLLQETIEMPNTGNFLMMFACVGGRWHLILFFFFFVKQDKLKHPNTHLLTESPVFLEKAFLEFLQASGNFQGSKEVNFDNFSTLLIVSVQE